MRLIDRESGDEIKPGDRVELNRRIYSLSGQDPKANKIFLFDPDGDGSPFPVGPGAIGARFAA